MDTHSPLFARVATPAEFDGLRDAWNGLFIESNAQSPFLFWEWVHAWWKAFGGVDEPLVLLIHRDKRLVGVAPLYVFRAHAGTRRLRIMGDPLADYLDVIAAPGEERAVAESVWRFLADH